MIDVLIPVNPEADRYLDDCVMSIERQISPVNIEVMYDDVGNLSVVRNELLKLATHEFVYYIDADDRISHSYTLSKLCEEIGDADYVWGDYDCYVTPRDRTIRMRQPKWERGPSTGSWLARRESFPEDPWRPMSEKELHRCDWVVPEDWVGVYVETCVYWHRVAWSVLQNSHEAPFRG